jgi:hypothetical protein
VAVSQTRVPPGRVACHTVTIPPWTLANIPSNGVFRDAERPSATLTRPSLVALLLRSIRYRGLG